MDMYFDFRIETDKEGRIVGIVWMTGQTRRTLEIYGSYLIFDMMRKEMNTSCLFLYSGVVMFRPDGTLRLASAALVATEDNSAYVFQVNATFEMAHKRTRMRSTHSRLD